MRVATIASSDGFANSGMEVHFAGNKGPDDLLLIRCLSILPAHFPQETPRELWAIPFPAQSAAP